MAQQAQPNQAATASQRDQAATAAKETSPEAADHVVATAEQTTCPVMEGNPINKAVFVEYKGKKVYFCCKACPEEFLADPEKYIAKLPQFQN
ncbi:MAG: YHS domain-containing protein [Phycisphaerae bacterium]|nr:YHS domain-containing protein [Phycisphaerae bacterium]